ncbi:MAG TPA: DUF4340 domain-containing protein, partial [Blastocatellia bacterium]|nr:DUF4340 domain-containing protein [Blastocatellia bacterium]
MQRMTLILLLVAGLAGIGVYYFEVKPGKTPEEADKTKLVFQNASREDITAINITRGAETINMELQDNRWMVKQPINTPADEAALNQLIGTMANARIDSEFTPAADQLKSYGLAEPVVKIEIRLKNGQTQRLELGNKDPIGTSAYGRINGAQNVSMLPIGLLSSADKPLNDFRDRALLNATQYELSALKVSNDSGSYELVKNDADWSIKSPIEGLADETEVNNLLVELTTAKSAEIVSETGDDLGKYGLDKSKLKFTAQLASGGERTVNIGSKVDGKYYAKVSDRPQILKVESPLIERLNTKLSALRSKNFVKFSRDDITEVQ